MAVPNVADRASAYAMPGIVVDGNDLPAVAAASRAAVNRARRGRPVRVECKTYRLRGHSKSDRNLNRTEEEIERGASAIRSGASKASSRAGRFSSAELPISKKARTSRRAGARIRQVERRSDPAQLTRMSMRVELVAPVAAETRSRPTPKPSRGARAGDGSRSARVPVRRRRRRLRRSFRRFGRPPLAFRFRARHPRRSASSVSPAAVGAASTGMKPVLEIRFPTS